MLWDEDGYDYEGEEIEVDETLFAIESNFPSSDMEQAIQIKEE